MSWQDSIVTQKGDRLFFDGVDIQSKIVEKFGTPTYVFSGSKIIENILHLRNGFRKHYPKTRIAFSMKNNLSPIIASLIADEVTIFETTSLVEQKIVEEIIQLKQKPLDLISTNLFKSDDLIRAILKYPNRKLDSHQNEHSKAYLAIDSYQDLRNVERLAKKEKKVTNVLIRVNPGIEMSLMETIFASAIPDAKCAAIIREIEPIISKSEDEKIRNWLPARTAPKIDSAENLIELAEKSKYLNLVGLHGHLGSQVTNQEYFDRFFKVIAIFMKLTEEKLERSLDVLDLGGGYPVQYSANQPVPAISSIAKSLTSELQKQSLAPELIIESGRFVTASAGIFLSRVNLTKQNPLGGKIAIMDFSVYSDLLDVLTANWFFESLLVNDLPEPGKAKETTDWILAGATNDTLDQLDPRIATCPNCQKNISQKEKRSFPRELRTGDIIAITKTGAYTTCFNSNYCGRPKPTALLLDKDDPEKIIII